MLLHLDTIQRNNTATPQVHNQLVVSNNHACRTSTDTPVPHGVGKNISISTTFKNMFLRRKQSKLIDISKFQ